jgi:hypothetical protein
LIVNKKAPYADTTVEAEKSIMEINKLLRLYGVTNYQWTTQWDDGIVTLKFALEVEVGKYIPIRMSPPAFLAKRKTWNAKTGKNDILELPNWAQSIRLLYWVLKTKLEAVAYGFREVREEFMGDILVKIPGGGETTMAQAMMKNIPLGKGTEALELGAGEQE